MYRLCTMLLRNFQRCANWTQISLNRFETDWKKDDAPPLGASGIVFAKGTVGRIALKSIEFSFDKNDIKNRHFKYHALWWPACTKRTFSIAWSSAKRSLSSISLRDPESAFPISYGKVRNVNIADEWCHQQSSHRYFPIRAVGVLILQTSHLLHFLQLLQLVHHGINFLNWHLLWHQDDTEERFIKVRKGKEPRSISSRHCFLAVFPEQLVLVGFANRYYQPAEWVHYFISISHVLILFAWIHFQQNPPIVVMWKVEHPHLGIAFLYTIWFLKPFSRVRADQLGPILELSISAPLSPCQAMQCIGVVKRQMNMLNIRNQTFWSCSAVCHLFLVTH